MSAFCDCLCLNTFRLTQLLLLSVICFSPGRTMAGVLPEPTDTSNVAPGVELCHWTLKEPLPRSIFVLDVDVNKANVKSAFVIGGADPDGPGAYHATNLTVLAAAERFRFDLAVNAGVIRNPPESSDAGNGWGRVYAPTMVDGHWLAAPEAGKTYPAVVIHTDGHFSLGSFEAFPEDALHVMPVHTGQLVKEGKAVNLSRKESDTANDPHPRTVIAVDKTGTHVTLVVVDGRDEDRAVGMTTNELEAWLVGLGVYDAMNLWGGGNTTLVLRDRPDGPIRIYNRPSDRNPQGFHTLRSGQTTLGFKFYNRR
ncbi:MAG: hypothetical protein CMJ47_13890 [Planctomyces sp.]|nr:hypothetical protein [Planctomyces sp.]